jgi:hypothetical protein
VFGATGLAEREVEDPVLLEGSRSAVSGSPRSMCAAAFALWITTSTASGLARTPKARSVSTAIRVQAMHESAPSLASIAGCAAPSALRMSSVFGFATAATVGTRAAEAHRVGFPMCLGLGALRFQRGVTVARRCWWPGGVAHWRPPGFRVWPSRCVADQAELDPRSLVAVAAFWAVREGAIPSVVTEGGSGGRRRRC